MALKRAGFAGLGKNWTGNQYVRYRGQMNESQVCGCWMRDQRGGRKPEHQVEAGEFLERAYFFPCNHIFLIGHFLIACRLLCSISVVIYEALTSFASWDE